MYPHCNVISNLSPFSFLSPSPCFNSLMIPFTVVHTSNMASIVAFLLIKQPSHSLAARKLVDRKYMRKASVRNKKHLYEPFLTYKRRRECLARFAWLMVFNDYPDYPHCVRVLLSIRPVYIRCRYKFSLCDIGDFLISILNLSFPHAILLFTAFFSCSYARRYSLFDIWSL